MRLRSFFYSDMPPIKAKNIEGPHLDETKATIPQMAVEVFVADTFTSRLYILSIGKSRINEPDSVLNHDTRDDYISIFCRKGSGYYLCEDRKYRLKTGDFLIVPPATTGQMASDSPDTWELDWIRFNGTDAELISKPWGESDGKCLHVPLKGEDSRFEYRTTMFNDIFKSMENGYGMDKMHYVTSILYHYFASIIYREAVLYTPDTNSFQGPIEKARQYMLSRLSEKITLDDICQHLAISTSYCTALFNKCTGKTPINYLQSMRIQKAINLLDNTDMKINEICTSVGINDPYYFSRLFTKTMGLSPTEYKKNKTVLNRESQ